MNKTEFYNKLTSLTKKTGQGLELKLAQLIPGFSRDMLNELIDEELVVMYHHPFSHLPNSDWICVNGVYNVEKDGKDSPGLFFMRYYMGFDDDLVEKFASQAGKTREDIIGEKLDEYKEFLNDNLEGLEAIKRLDVDIQLDESLSDDTITFMKERAWYKDNLIVSECITRCIDANKTTIKKIDIHKQLNSLYCSASGYEKDRIKNNDDLLDAESELKNRKKLVNILTNCKDKSKNVQGFLSEYI